MPNLVILSGRLTADPELRITGSGVSVCNFCLAVPRPYKAGEARDADFVNIVAWRQTAEFICKYFKKGSGIGINGSIRTDCWLGDDGRSNYKVEVLAEKAEFPLSGKNQETREAAKPKEQANADIDGFIPVLGEDLPF